MQKNQTETIRQNDLITEMCDDHSTKSDSQFSKFTMLSLDDTLNLINSSFNSSCYLDPILTPFLKNTKNHFYTL